MQTCSDLYTQAHNSPNQKRFELTNIIYPLEILIRCFGDDFFGQSESILQLTISLMEKHMCLPKNYREMIVKDKVNIYKNLVTKIYGEELDGDKLKAQCNLIQTIAETYKSKAYPMPEQTSGPLCILLQFEEVLSADLNIKLLESFTAVCKIAPSEVDRVSEILETNELLESDDVEQNNGVMKNLAEVIEEFGEEIAQGDFNSFLQSMTKKIIKALKVDRSNMEKRSEKKQYEVL